MKLETIKHEKTKEEILSLLEKIKNCDENGFKELLNKLPFHNYSLYNSLIIAFSGASQVAGFNTWKKINRNVKAGSKAIYILAPMISKKKTTTKTGEEKDRVYISGFRGVPVFDISQTEGQPIEKGFTTEIKKDFNIKELAEKLKLSVDYKPLEIALGGYIEHSTSKITLNSNLTETENKGTFIHEVSHYLLGHTGVSADSKSKDIKEQEAETLTYLINKIFWIERKSEFYLKSWNTNESILNSLGNISKALSKFKLVIGIQKKGVN